MPGDMPYYLEKGPYLTEMELHLSNPDNAKAALAELRAGNPIPDIGGVLASAAAKGGINLQELRRHIYEDWFGFESTGRNAWAPPQPGHDPLANPTTGYWQGYYGDVEGILRRTLCRALEVCLGLPHEPGKTTGLAANRFWPIEFWWKCGQGWWEGWVTWRNNAHAAANPSSQTGQVTVIFATPGTGHQVLEDPTKGRKLPDFMKDPTSTATPGPGERYQGSWVVTHNVQKRQWVRTTEGTPFSVLPLPMWGTGYIGTGDIVTVQPCFADGGTVQ